MPIVLGLTAFIGLILLANGIEASKNQTYTRLFTWFLIALNLPVFLFGLGVMVLPPETLLRLSVNGVPLFVNAQTGGLTLALMGLWGLGVSLPAVRLFLAKLLPHYQAESAMHALGLVLAGYLVGNTAFSLTQGGLEELAETAVTISIPEILLMQIIFAAIALLSIGLYTRRSAAESRTRLGLEQPTHRQLLIGTGWIFGLVLLQAIGGAIWLLLDKSQAELLEGISTNLYGNIDTVWEWALLAAATGTGEELLFRGAVQPVFGIGFTAFLFASAHVQYGITPATFVVFIIGIILGLIRQRYNTTTSIFVHSGYNFVLGMLSLLALQMEHLVK